MSGDHSGVKPEVIDSTGNVFADLDLPSSQEDMLKVQIARAITNTIRKRELTQVEAARLLGVDQAKISQVIRGRLKGLSVGRLFHFLAMLGRDVNIHVSAKYKNAPGRIKMSA